MPQFIHVQSESGGLTCRVCQFKVKEVIVVDSVRHLYICKPCSGAIQAAFSTRNSLDLAYEVMMKWQEDELDERG